LRPEFDVTLAYNPASVLIPVARLDGIGFTWGRHRWRLRRWPGRCDAAGRQRRPSGRARCSCAWGRPQWN
jgi:hypothetical protein